MSRDRSTGGFPPEAFRRRRERAFQELGDGIMVLPSAPVLHRSADTEHRYRPDSELFYLTGCLEPGAVAALVGGDEPRFLLFVRKRDPDAELWTGPRLGPDAAQEAFQVDETHPLSALGDVLPGLLDGARWVHFRMGRREDVERMVVEALERARLKGRRKGTGPRGVTDPE